MKITKIINNNVLSAINDHGDEVVVIGKGIAFQMKMGDQLDEKKIEKTFYLENTGLYHKFQKLLKEITIDQMKVADDIISYARRTLQRNLNESIYISLPDHISCAIDRAKKGLEVKNALLWEIKRLYSKEFKVAEVAVRMIENELHVRLSEDEVGFIAFHFVNAELNNEMPNIVNITILMKAIINIVKYHFNIVFDEESLHYYRFITHLEFFAQRICSHSVIKDNDYQLYEMVRKNYPEANECVLKICNYIEQKYNYSVSTDEQLYLIIHIQRLITRE